MIRTCATAALVCVLSFCRPGFADTATGYTLHPASGMVRIGGPSGIDPAAGNKYSLALAGHEGECFQVEVRGAATQASPTGSAVASRPATDPVTGSSASAPTVGEASPMRLLAQLRPDKANPPGAPEIRMYQVLDLNYQGPPADSQIKIPVRNTGWIPDVCLPTDEAVAQEHKPDRVTFCFDVHAGKPPAKATSYRYRLAFNTHVGAKADCTLPEAVLDLDVTVYPVDLPARLPFKTSVHWDWQIAKYLGRELTAQERIEYLKFFLDCRFTPAVFFGKGPNLSDAEIKLILDGGGNVFQLYQIGGGGKRPLTDAQKTDLAPKLAKWREQMKSAGALDYCYALIADEPLPDAFPIIRANAQWLKAQFPELRIWVATRPAKELLDVVDCWDPIIMHSTDTYAPHSYTKESAALARSSARKPEIWWFYSYEPFYPKPNAKLDDALVDSRAIGWLSYAAKVDGFEYVWATDWSANAALRDTPWPEKASKWNCGLAGFGVLAYPGDDGKPIPSLRLLNLRDGFEDWAMALAAGAQGAKLAPANPRDPEQLAKARLAVYQWLSEHPASAPAAK